MKILSKILALQQAMYTFYTLIPRYNDIPKVRSNVGYQCLLKGAHFDSVIRLDF